MFFIFLGGNESVGWLLVAFAWLCMPFGWLYGPFKELILTPWTSPGGPRVVLGGFGGSLGPSR